MMRLRLETSCFRPSSAAAFASLLSSSPLSPSLPSASRISFTAARYAIACTVFPSPISSARIPPNPMAPSVMSHRNPNFWYGLNSAFRPAGTS